jgi:hypothetical protein
VDLSRLDRRWIFLLMGLAVTVPMLFNISPEVQVTRDTREIYDAIDSLDAGDYVMISFDFEASSFPEMSPLAVAVLNHIFKKNLKVVGLALFSEGTAIGYTLLSEVAQKHGKQYGEDYIYLGFRPQYVSAILLMGESIVKVFPEDYLKKPLEDYPEFAGLNNYDDLPLVISVADGSLPIHWAEYANARYNQKVAVACAAVMVTAFKPYFESGQLIGPAAGIKGAAEYEKILGQKGTAHRRLFAQSTAHLFIIIMVIAANIAAWRRKKR